MSTASPARVEANRKNATHSTGPRTPEGKAVSRANSLKHGMTGAGIVVPQDDLDRIAEIADLLRAKHEPSDPFGMALVDRASTLIVRLQRCGKNETAIVTDSVNTALHNFDQFRLDHADDLFAGLPDNPEALRELKAFPEGVDRLIAEWTSLAAIDEWSVEDLDRVALISHAKLDNPGLVFDSIPDEVRRLETIKAAIDPRPRDIARQQAADLALFPTTQEAILARKYDAATDRALEKTMKLLKQGATLASSVAIDPGIEPDPGFQVPQLTSRDLRAFNAAQALTPLAPKASQVATPAPPLASFSPPSAPLILTKEEVVPIILNRPVDRSRRPDPVKARKAMKAQKRKQR